MSATSTQCEYTNDCSSKHEAMEIHKTFSGPISIKPTPIFRYKEEILNPKVDPDKFMEVIDVVLRAPDKPLHRKIIKFHLEPQPKGKGFRDSNVRRSSAVEKRVDSMGVGSKHFRIHLDKNIRTSLTNNGLSGKKLMPNIKFDKKRMKELLERKSTIKFSMGFDSLKIYNLGEAGCGLWRSVVQDFKKIHDHHLKNEALFVDTLFPPTVSSITKSGKLPHCFWKRPKDILLDAKFFIKGLSRLNIEQGCLGETWLLDSMATLSRRHNLFLQTVPLDQSFSSKYTGIFHFRFWQYGRWIDVVIDDLLPVNHKGILLFSGYTAKKEFWPALLEKAYAKLHGSYEALTSGSCREGIEDLTGGLTESYCTRDPPPNLLRILKRALNRGSLITIVFRTREGLSSDKIMEMGLVEGRTYMMTRVLQKEVKLNGKMKELQLIRLRNAWENNDVDWKGAWSERSPEWINVPKEVKDLVGLVFDYDGEFWMSLTDVLTYGSYIDVCNLNPESTNRAKKWEVALFEGEWVKEVSAGGCSNFKETFARNPQYLITLEEPDDKNSQLCTVIISLSCKNRHRLMEMGQGVLNIGFVIYYIKDPKSTPKPLDETYLYTHKFFDYCDFTRLRSATKRFELPIGTYCIIPSTFAPDESGEFVLRVFSEQKVFMKENEEEIGLFKQKRLCLCDPNKSDITSVVLPDAIEEQSIQDEIKPMPEPAPEPIISEPVIIAEPEQKGDDVMPKEPEPKVKHHPEPPKIIPDEPNAPEAIDPLGRSSFLSETVEKLSEEIASMTAEDLSEKKMRSSRIISSDPHLQKEIENTFLTLSGDDEEINWEDLQKLLDLALKNLPKYKAFDNDLCRCLVAFYDENQSGKLFYEEFARLCREITSWTSIFYKHCNEQSEILSGNQLRNVIKEAGFVISNHILNLVVHRFGNGEGAIEYQDAIMCLIRIKNMISGFLERRSVITNTAEFKLEDFMNFVLYS